MFSCDELWGRLRLAAMRADPWPAAASQAASSGCGHAALRSRPSGPGRPLYEVFALAIRGVDPEGRRVECFHG
jgi:hypothetical protein